MASSVKKKLARRKEFNTTTAFRNVRTNNASTINGQEMHNLDYSNWLHMGKRRNKDTNQADAVAIQTFINPSKQFNGSRRGDWNVGYNILSAL